MQANTLADNPYYWQLHENMVCLLNVSLFDSDSGFRCTFYLQLSRSFLHPILNNAKALEGQATV